MNPEHTAVSNIKATNRVLVGVFSTFLAALLLVAVLGLWTNYRSVQEHRDQAEDSIGVTRAIVGCVLTELEQHRTASRAHADAAAQHHGYSYTSEPAGEIYPDACKDARIHLRLGDEHVPRHAPALNEEAP